MPVQYPIRAAAKLTGISLDTLRAWERRYQAVTPIRTERGRFYSEAQIRRLLLLRGAVESGRSISQVASLPDEELEQLERETASLAPKSQAPQDPALQPLLHALDRYDYAAVNDHLGRLALLLRPSELVHAVVLPLMRLTGEKWESGAYQIGHEHMLSACLRNLLGGLVRLQVPAKTNAAILFTTPSGELHEFGILAAAMLSVARGFPVSYLGPNLPGRELVAVAEKSRPRAVVLGIMKCNASAAMRDEVSRIASELPESTELWLAGTGAADVSAGVQRNGLFLLADHLQFEHHLSRLEAMPLSK